MSHTEDDHREPVVQRVVTQNRNTQVGHTEQISDTNLNSSHTGILHHYQFRMEPTIAATSVWQHAAYTAVTILAAHPFLTCVKKQVKPIFILTANPSNI